MRECTRNCTNETTKDSVRTTARVSVRKSIIPPHKEVCNIMDPINNPTSLCKTFYAEAYMRKSKGIYKKHYEQVYEEVRKLGSYEQMHVDPCENTKHVYMFMFLSAYSYC